MPPAELTPALYQGWGRALGVRLPPMAKFLVGGDVRGLDAAVPGGAVEGLCRAGLDVVDLGLLPTPMIYYAKQRLARRRLRHRHRFAQSGGRQRAEVDDRRPAADAG